MSGSTVKDRMDALNHFMGYGDPSSKYWFIGIDEQGDFDPQKKDMELAKLNIFVNELFKQNKNQFTLFNKEFNELYKGNPAELEKGQYDSTYQGISQIYEILTQSKLSLENIGDSGNDVFISNLFPIGRGSTSKSSYGEFVKENIYPEATFEKWKEEYWNIRKKLLSEFISDYLKRGSLRKIILFGTGYVHYFNELFSEMPSFEKMELDYVNGSTRKYKCYIGQNNQLNVAYYLIYHPSRRNRNFKRFTEEYLKLIFNKDENIVGH